MSNTRNNPCNTPLSAIRQRGFTLLEILVVVAIIGVLMGIALTTLSFDRSEQVLRDKVYDFQQFYHAVQDEALLTGKTQRLRFTQRGFVLERRQNSTWENTAIDGQSTLDFSEAFTLSLTPKTPLLLLPDGQNKPFRLTLTLANIKQQISGDAMGNLTVTTP